MKVKERIHFFKQDKPDEEYDQHYLKNRESYHRYYLRNKEKILNFGKEWRKKNRDKFKAYNDRFRKNRIMEWRQELLHKLGGKCIKCGFKDIRALQFDHIKSNGSIERKGKNTDYLLKEWLKDTDIHKKIQVLCANCNWIKRYTNNEL